MGTIKKCKCCGQFMSERHGGQYVNGKFIKEPKTFVSWDNPEECFTCNFWKGHIEHDRNPSEFQIPFVYKHKHYIADMTPNIKHNHCKGFGGAKTRISFNDGRVIECDNVWFQGEIPQRFWKFMPDNAKLEWL